MVNGADTNGRAAVLNNLDSLGSAIRLDSVCSEYIRDIQEILWREGEEGAKTLFIEGPVLAYASGYGQIASTLHGENVGREFGRASIRLLTAQCRNYNVPQLINETATSLKPAATRFFLNYFLGEEYVHTGGNETIQTLVDGADWQIVDDERRYTAELRTVKDIFRLLANSNPNDVRYLNTTLTHGTDGLDDDLNVLYNVFLGNFRLYRDLSLRKMRGDQEGEFEMALNIVRKLAGPFVGDRIAQNARNMVNEGQLTKDYVISTAGAALDANLEGFVIDNPQDSDLASRKPIVPHFVENLSLDFRASGDVTRIIDGINSTVDEFTNLPLREAYDAGDGDVPEPEEEVEEEPEPEGQEPPLDDGADDQEDIAWDDDDDPEDVAASQGQGP